ncbi:hypothetical protein F2Q68_00005550 [Brassica cretica]|uniref:Uncharacterized protein n=1 Tax=Brassica cretica TaxID=69181 RepID=A0A8S9JMR8_BRACR|nr:hypothetical protein F2Q68_00005550 [Brassica cretica]
MRNLVGIKNVDVGEFKLTVIARTGPGRVWRTRLPVLKDRVVKNSLLNPPRQQPSWTNIITRNQGHTLQASRSFIGEGATTSLHTLSNPHLQDRTNNSTRGRANQGSPRSTTDPF